MQNNGQTPLQGGGKYPFTMVFPVLKAQEVTYLHTVNKID